MKLKGARPIRECIISIYILFCRYQWPESHAQSHYALYDKKTPTTSTSVVLSSV